MRTILIIAALTLAGCAAPSGPPPVPYPMEGVTVYGASWIATDAQGVAQGRRSRQGLLAGLRALGVQFRDERRWRAVSARIEAENEED